MKEITTIAPAIKSTEASHVTLQNSNNTLITTPVVEGETVTVNNLACLDSLMVLTGNAVEIILLSVGALISASTLYNRKKWKFDAPEFRQGTTFLALGIATPLITNWLIAIMYDLKPFN
jgi:hypothetical protein